LLQTISIGLNCICK